MIALAAVTMISCMDGGSFSQTYTADISFEFSDNIYKESFRDSIFVLEAAPGQIAGEGFSYGSYPISFSQRYLDGVVHGGFLMSCLKGEKDGALTREHMANDAYRVYAESGNLGTKTYAVFYDNPVESMMPKHDIEFVYKDNGYMAPSRMYVNNTTLVARKIKEHFQVGDKLTLKAIGVTENGAAVETSITLAEYTVAKDSIMYSWTPFQLSSLGVVDYVDFKVESTNPEVPGYFCMDNFVSGVSVEY